MNPLYFRARFTQLSSIYTCSYTYIYIYTFIHSTAKGNACDTITCLLGNAPGKAWPVHQLLEHPFLSFDAHLRMENASEAAMPWNVWQLKQKGCCPEAKQAQKSSSTE